MKRIFLLCVLCVLSLSMVACGSKGGKLDTAKDNHNTIDEELNLPRELEDDCVSVIEYESLIDADGKEKMIEQYVYDEAGKMVKLKYSYKDASGLYKTTENQAVYDEKDNFLDFYDCIVDASGYVLLLDPGDNYEVDGEGYLKLLKSPEGFEKQFEYENGKLKSIKRHSKNQDDVVEYEYDGNVIVKKISKYFRQNRLTQEEIKVYDGDDYLWENKIYGNDGSVLIDDKIQLDELGLCKMVDKMTFNGIRLQLEGSYNVDKTIYTMMIKTNNAGADVKGYQVKLSLDGRPIKAYKIGIDGKPLSDDLVGEFVYDKDGHLSDVYVKDYVGVEAPAETKHIHLKRVPKEYYEENIYNRFEVRNRYSFVCSKPISLLNLIEMAEERNDEY